MNGVPKIFDNQYDNMKFFDSLNPEELSALLRQYQELKELNKENKEIAGRQANNYEDKAQREAEMQEYMNNEAILDIQKANVFFSEREIRKLEEAIGAIQSENAELDSYETSINSDRDAIERKEAENFSLSPQESKDIPEIESALKYIRITRIKRENEIKAIMKQIEAFKEKINRFNEEIKRLTDRQNQIKENQKNGYINVEKKNLDEETLKLNESLIEENNAKLNDLVRKYELKEKGLDTTSFSEVINAIKTLNKNIEIEIDSTLEGSGLHGIYSSISVGDLNLPKGFNRDGNSITNKNNTTSGAYITIEVKPLVKEEQKKEPEEKKEEPGEQQKEPEKKEESSALSDPYSVDHLKKTDDTNKQTPGVPGVVNNQVPPTSERKRHKLTGMSKGKITNKQIIVGSLIALGAIAVSALTGGNPLVGIAFAATAGSMYYAGRWTVQGVKDLIKTAFGKEEEEKGKGKA